MIGHVIAGAGREPILAILRQSNSLGCLSEAELEHIVSCSTMRCFSKGEFILLEGDRASGYYVVLEGKVRIIKQSPCGRVFTMFALQPGDAVNDISIFNESPVPVSAEAIRATRLLIVERTEFLAVASRNLVLVSRIMATVGKRLQSQTDRLMYAVADRAHRRVWSAILTLFTEHGVVIPCTHRDIADLAGVTRETTSRAIAYLRNLKLVNSYRGGIILLNPGELEQLFAQNERASSGV